MQISVTVAGCTKTTGYIRLGPHMPDIILVKQEVEYQLTGDQVQPPQDCRLERVEEALCTSIQAFTADRHDCRDVFPAD